YKSIPNVRYIRPDIYLLHIGVRAFAAFGDEAIDPLGDNGQRDRAELEHGIVESADVEFETRSFPNLLVATLATLPSMSLIPRVHSLRAFSPLSRRIVFLNAELRC